VAPKTYSSYSAQSRVVKTEKVKIVKWRISEG